jgi:hypothetical protein
MKLHCNKRTSLRTAVGQIRQSIGLSFTDGLPSAADASSQGSKLAKSAILYGPAARSKMAFEIDERESCNNVFGL